MTQIEYIFAKDLKEGDVLIDPPPEVYTGAPSGPFVEHTRVVAVEHAFLRGFALGRVRDLSPLPIDPEQLLYQIFPDAQNIDKEQMAELQPVFDALKNVVRWVPAAKPEHEIPEVKITTRRYGEGPPEREVHEDGAQLNSEQTITLRWGAVVGVIRGDLSQLTEKK